MKKLISLFVLFGFVLATALSSAYAYDKQGFGPAEATEHVIIMTQDLQSEFSKDSIMLIDTSSKDAFAAKHIKGSVNMSMNDIALQMEEGSLDGRTLFLINTDHLDGKTSYLDLLISFDSFNHSAEDAGFQMFALPVDALIDAIADESAAKSIFNDKSLSLLYSGGTEGGIAWEGINVIGAAYSVVKYLVWMPISIFGELVPIILEAMLGLEVDYNQPISALPALDGNLLVAEDLKL